MGLSKENQQIRGGFEQRRDRQRGLTALRGFLDEELWLWDALPILQQDFRGLENTKVIMRLLNTNILK